MRCGVVVFPGSNCDHDVYHVLKHVLEQDATFLWHQDETTVGNRGLVVGVTFDGGSTWRLAPLPGVSQDSGGSLQSNADRVSRHGCEGQGLRTGCPRSG